MQDLETYILNRFKLVLPFFIRYVRYCCTYHYHSRFHTHTSLAREERQDVWTWTQFY